MRRKLTKAMLLGMLKAFRIPLHKWGKGQAKTFEKLYHSFSIAETEARIISLAGKVAFVLYCNKVKIYIYCEVDGKLYYLNEVQRIRNGNPFGYSRGRSISEKMHRRESQEAAALRAIEEELHQLVPLITDENRPRFERRGRYFGKPRPSNSWPGLYTMGPRYRLVCRLHPSLFLREGHKQYENGQHVATFEWREITLAKLMKLLPRAPQKRMRLVA